MGAMNDRNARETIGFSIDRKDLAAGEKRPVADELILRFAMFDVLRDGEVLDIQQVEGVMRIGQHQKRVIFGFNARPLVNEQAVPGKHEILMPSRGLQTSIEESVG